MDSSRSGLLSTILMTLPLIVVPAVALLRPPGSVNGVSTVDLDASEDEEFDTIFDDMNGLVTSASEEEDQRNSESKTKSSAEDFVFQDEHEHDRMNPDTQNPSENLKTPAPANLPSSDPFIPEMQKAGSSGAETDPTDPPSATSGEEQLVDQLTALGALRTMWFNAGETAPVGFAAFFRGQTELTRIRFEAVGQSREECARNVLEQVTRWQQQN